MVVWDQEAEETSDRMSWGKGLWLGVLQEAATLLFVKERDLLGNFLFLRNVAKTGLCSFFLGPISTIHSPF